MTHLLSVLTRLLRDPQGLVESADHPAGLIEIAPPLLLATGVGAGLFGAVVGSHHGGIQILFAALKLPVLLLLPPILALPAVHGAWKLIGVEARWRRLSAATLVGMARTAVLAAALGPVVWLAFSGGLDYHMAVLAFAGTLVLAGLPGIATVLRALPSGGELRAVAVAGSIAVLGAVFAQTGWLLRPFLARPTAEITLLRPVEEDILSSLQASGHSAVGDYTGWSATRRGFMVRDQDGGGE